MTGVQRSPGLAGWRKASWMTGVQRSPGLAGWRKASWMTGVQRSPGLAGWRKASWMTGVQRSPGLAGGRSHGWQVYSVEVQALLDWRSGGGRCQSPPNSTSLWTKASVTWFRKGDLTLCSFKSLYKTLQKQADRNTGQGLYSRLKTQVS